MEKTKFRWTRDKVEKLITLFENHKYLYDKNHAYYTNKEKKQETFNYFLTQFHGAEDYEFLTVEMIKMKIKILRIQYAHEFKMIECAKKKGIQFKPGLWSYSKLHFLRDHLKKKTIFPWTDNTDLNDEVKTDMFDQSADFDDPIGNKHFSNYGCSEETNFSQQINHFCNTAEKKQDEQDEVEYIQSDHDGYYSNSSEIKHNTSIEPEPEDVSVYQSSNTINTYNSLSPISDRLIHIEEALTYKKEKKYEWLGKQVVFEMNKIQSEEVQEEAAWDIQSILRKHLQNDRSLRKVQQK